MKIKKILLGFIFLVMALGAVYLLSEPLFTPTALPTSAMHHHFPQYIAHKSLLSEDEVMGNTLSAIQNALSSHVHAMELDIRFSKDRVPFVFHADRLEKTTDGKGVPENYTWEQLKKLNYQNPNRTKILSLDEAFKLIGGQKYIFLDVKDKKLFNKVFAKSIVDLIRKYHLQESVVVESFNPFFLVWVRLAARDVAVMYTFTNDGIADSKESQNQFDKIPWLLRNKFFQKQVRRVLRPDLLGPRWNTEEAYLKRLIQQGYPLIVWTVDDKQLAQRLFNLGVKGIQTNNPLKLMPGINHLKWVYDAGGTKAEVSQIVHVKKAQDVLNAISEAILKNKKISIGGRRHSMGGQALLKDTIHLDMIGFNQVAYDPKTKTVKAQSGATWKKIQTILSQNGRSVSVMQSDNIFTVGGSVSVNVHGWQVGSEPIGSTIVSMTLAAADGKIYEISPINHLELFKAVIGGYGQFGVILDLTLKTVPNELLKFNAEITTPKNFGERYHKLIELNPKAQLAYGRVLVSKKRLFDEIGLFWFEKIEGSSSEKDIKPESLVAFKRGAFRVSEYFDIGKQFRWYIEKKYSKHLMKMGPIPRNDAMNTDIHILWPLYGDKKDILHEYFIPKDSLDLFLEKFKILILGHKPNLLNVTIREVKKDTLSKLPYAKQDVFALVCFFSQGRTAKDEKEMEVFTEAVIDEVLALNGTFYLPYRLHYTREQLFKAYPEIPGWVEMKKVWDPNHIFDSQFFQYLMDSQ